MKKTNFFVKIALIFFAFGFFLSGIMALTNIIWMEKGFMRELQNSAKNRVDDIVSSKSFGEGIYRADLTIISESIALASSSENVSYVGLYMDDKVVINSGLDILNKEKIKLPVSYKTKTPYFEKVTVPNHEILDCSIPFSISPEISQDTSSEDMMFGTMNVSEPSPAEKKEGVIRLGLKMDNIERHLATYRRQNIVIMIITLGLCIILAIFVSMAISSPIKKLHAGVEMVRQGDFDYRVSLKSRDELGQLAESFNDMVDEIGILNHLSQDFSKLITFDEWESALLNTANTVFSTDGLSLIVQKGDLFQSVGFRGSWDDDVQRILEEGIKKPDKLALWMEEMTSANETRETPAIAYQGAMETVGEMESNRYHLLLWNESSKRPISPRHRRILRAVAGQASQSLERIALHEAVVEKSAKEKELHIASRIQTAILTDVPVAPGYEISAGMIPAEEVGGDYYDVLSPDGKEFWIGIGDVSGHGVNAGLIMMMTQSMISGVVTANPSISPERVITYVNKMLFENIQRRMKEDQYMTLLVLKHLDEGRFSFAGKHLSIIIYRKKDMDCEILSTDGIWMAVLPEIKYKRINYLTLNPGDLMVLYTDGITEARNDKREFFDIPRLVDLIKERAGLPPVTIRDSIFDSVNAWTTKQKDDMTLLVLKRWE